MNALSHGQLDTSKELARFSCDGCRSRKIKCDRTRPSCSNCFKLTQTCIYLPSKKRVGRRQRYSDVSKRLERMESVSQLFHATAGKDGPSLSTHAETLDPPSPSDETGFYWDVLKVDTHTKLTNADKDLQRAENESDVIHAPPGFCSIFSYQGAQSVDALAEDTSFSQAVAAFNVSENPSLELFEGSGSFHPLPPIAEVVNGITAYMSDFNPEVPLFQETVMIKVVEQYIAAPSGLGMVESTAINIMLAHAKYSGCLHKNSTNSQHCFQNAVRAISTLVISETCDMSVGALLCIVQYLMYQSQLKPAVAILGSTVQKMLLAGYHTTENIGKRKAPEVRHRNGLFWQAYIMDAVLSLRLRKPQAITSTNLVRLPEMTSSETRGELVFDSNSKINFLRERVALAKIQSRTYTLLYSAEASRGISTTDVYGNMVTLDRELQSWKASIPALARPQKHLANYGRAEKTCLAVLHYTYFQLVIAIHSVVFAGIQAQDLQEQKRKAIPSVALCVGAARASISLLNYEHCSIPFTVSLLHQVSWSIDILFINILQNKKTSQAHRDLALIEKVVKFFEKFDDNYQNSTPYRICNLLYNVALRAIHNALYEVKLPAGATISRRKDTLVTENLLDTEMSLTTDTDQQRGFITPVDTPLGGLQDNLNTWEPDDWPPMGPEWTMPLAFQAEYWQDFSSWTDDMNDEFQFPAFGYQ